MAGHLRGPGLGPDAGPASRPSPRGRRDDQGRGDGPASGGGDGQEPTNEAGNILAAWIACEALLPQSYRQPADLAAGDRARVSRLDGDDLPWRRGEHAGPDHRLYFQIVLGAIPVDKAMDALVRVFGDDDERSRRENEKAVIAAILVDSDGLVLPEKAVAISSFGWALPQALKGDLMGLGAWPGAEKDLVEALTRRLKRQDAEGRILPLDGATLSSAFDWLVATLALPAALVEAPSFAIRIRLGRSARRQPEVDLLNSFFLGDLALALPLVTSGKAGAALARYLGAGREGASGGGGGGDGGGGGGSVVDADGADADDGQAVNDLLARPDLIEALVAPQRTPPVRWPAPGGHPLVTLQQAAVNAARGELAGPGIAAVNGPPGTGKTTLLRDIVAAAVLDRAQALASFDNPQRAFRSTGQQLPTGDRAYVPLHALDPSLKGHEVVVASSNNKAVENVSRELPALKAIGRDLRHFRTVSARLAARRDEDGHLVEGEATWGLIAAVLGNSANRSACQEALWWDGDRSLRVYLKAAGDAGIARGTGVKEGTAPRAVGASPDRNTGIAGEEAEGTTGAGAGAGAGVEAGTAIDADSAAETRTWADLPTILRTEAPPTPTEARANWQRERGRFQRLLAEVNRDLERLEGLRRACLRAGSARAAMRQAEADLKAAQQAERAAAEARGGAEAACADADLQFDRVGRLADHALAQRPGWLHRLFRTAAFRRWQDEHQALVTALARAHDRINDARAARDAARQHHQDAARDLEERAADHDARYHQLLIIETGVQAARKELGSRLVDDRFFDRGHEHWNLASPWLPDALQRKREDLFSSALDLHRAFIDVAARKVAHNLRALLPAMQAGAFDDPAQRALLPDLWATFFLVCPVISTTFASVERMLGDLPAESLGWTLIDEAGQATPQSAVGLILRSRRTLVVGDPLQIPPVVPLPRRLVIEIARYFRIDPGRWMAEANSVQTLADQASAWKARFSADTGHREVGLPLLVHRRCREPMFSIANRIAYDGQMVHAVADGTPGPIASVLGPSTWLDIRGEADTKWCADEGEVVIRLLTRLADAGIVSPDVYVITPFRIIATELRRRIRAEPGLLKRLGGGGGSSGGGSGGGGGGGSSSSDGDHWLAQRVGTIHTFQGKEADAVIAVLGAPMSSQIGARRWAATTPNIFNVMVTRAKEVLYIVGSRPAWSTIGHGRTVAECLPTTAVTNREPRA